MLRLHNFLASRLQVIILAPFPAFTPQHGKSPLDYAQTTGKAAVVQLLRAAEDTCSLHIAADEGSEPIVRRLLAMGAPVNEADEVRDLWSSIGRGARIARVRTIKRALLRGVMGVDGHQGAGCRLDSLSVHAPVLA